MTTDSLASIDAEMFAEVGRQLAAADEATIFQRLTRIAVDLVPGAEQAGITRGRRGHFATDGATSAEATAIDQIQYRLGSGPCVDALEGETVFRIDDMSTDTRWPRFARETAASTPIRSMLSFRLFLEDDTETVAALNLLARGVAAFDEQSYRIGLILATHGGLAISGAIARDRAQHLERALENSREIGIAVGIVMALHKVPRDQAFDLLRTASQATHRKLAELVREVVDTGAIPLGVQPQKPPPKSG